MPACLIEARDIVKSFGSRKILSKVSLTLNANQILTLIGPNGAGKTTLVRIILGLEQADEGELKRAPGLKVGYMPQKITVDPTLPLTVTRFLQLAHSELTAVDRVLALLGIERIARNQLREISGGEFQRVLLARALLREPQVLVLDEPAQGVDLGGQGELYELIGNLKSELGIGILMISHDLNLVMSATDEVICLNHHVCCHGKPEQVSADPAYLTLFGHDAPSSLAVYTHEHNHSHDITGEVIEQHEGHDH